MKTKDLLSQFQQELTKNRNKEAMELSKCDIAISDLMHYLELEKCDAVDMVMIAKKLKAIRKKRREAKIEIDKINSVLSSIGNRDLTKFDRKKYTYKTSELKDIQNRHLM